MQEMWGPEQFVEKMLERAERERQLQRSVPWTERKSQLLKALQELLGDFSDVPERPLEPKPLERTELDTVVRERIEFTAGEGLRIPAYVIAPKAAAAGKRPAVLALHGHGWGSREMVGLTPDGQPNTELKTGHGDTVMQLAERGFVVLVPEVIGFGDRRLARDIHPQDPKSNSCFTLGTALLLAGKTLAGLRVFEASRALDYLQHRNDVDPERIGVIGYSGGGMIASLTAALDERIRAAVICSYSNTYRDSILSMRHCLDNYIPSILKHAEMPELLSLIAPRALFIESGENDRIFPEHGAREAVRIVSDKYRELDQENRIAFDIFPGGHEISGRRSFDWLRSMV